jgi:hypothetical protein
MSGQTQRITNIEAGCSEYGDYWLSCTLGPVKYHVWLDRKTRELKDTLYKKENGVVRLLRTNTVFGAELISVMRSHADAEKLFDKAEAKIEEEKEANKRKNEEYQRQELIQAAAPELFQALQSIVIAWDSPKEKAALSYTHLETAKFAIAKAEGKA